MAKKAKFVMAKFYADCPECGGGLIDPYSGSFLLTVNQFNADTLFLCNDCGKEFKVVKSAFNQKGE